MGQTIFCHFPLCSPHNKIWSYSIPKCWKSNEPHMFHCTVRSIFRRCSASFVSPSVAASNRRLQIHKDQVPLPPSQPALPPPLSPRLGNFFFAVAAACLDILIKYCSHPSDSSLSPRATWSPVASDTDEIQTVILAIVFSLNTTWQESFTLIHSEAPFFLKSQ